MKICLRLICIFLVYGLIVSCLSAATVKKRDGQVVEGEISGLIILKGKVEESASEKDPSKTKYTASYILINGKGIIAIGEEGVHNDANKLVIISVSQEQIPLDDTDVVKTAVNAPEGAMVFAYTKAGGTVTRMGVRRKGTTPWIEKDKLLGEFRVDPQTKESRIISALEIITEKGVVTVPVDEIVEFKEDN